MEYSKLQIGCMVIVLYMTFIYICERKAYKVKERETIFEWLLVLGILEIIFDGVTAYTVNHLESVPYVLNGILHMCFLCSMDAVMFLVFMYIIDITRGLPKSKRKRFALLFPLIVNMVVVILFMPQLEYRHGTLTNYSMGISAYICFIMIALYMLAMIVLLVVSWKNLGRYQLITISTCAMAMLVVGGYQMTHPEALISCMFVTIAIVGTYLNMENPVFTKLQNYHNEMVMGFATLVENRDDSTGGHIKRTTEYVRLLAEELKAKGFYKEELTRDYIDNLVMAAPMHDVGKIAIPDAILQKPGKLTQEEYDIMKTHAERGGKIIHETFGHMGDSYGKLAYDVARYHHEKWNGKGYPDGLSRKEIPLCARIMTVADVFDAVSEKRCYREALPLEECFQIIAEGSGQDFDPVIVEVFLDMKDKIQEVHDEKFLKSHH